MHDNNLEKLISEALRGSPPAPEELRHNVMSEIRARNSARGRRPRRGVYAAASAAAVIVVALGAILWRGYGVGGLKNDTASLEYSMSILSQAPADNAQIYTESGYPGHDSGSGGDAEEYDLTDPERAEAPAYGGGSDDNAFSAAIPEGTANDAKLSELQNTLSGMGEDAQVLLIRGELPGTLAGYENTLLEEGVYMYVELPEETVLALIADGAEGEVDGSSASVVVLWIPGGDTADS